MKVRCLMQIQVVVKIKLFCCKQFLWYLNSNVTLIFPRMLMNLMILMKDLVKMVTELAFPWNINCGTFGDSSLGQKQASNHLLIALNNSVNNMERK